MPQVAGTDPGLGMHGWGTTLSGAVTGVIGMILTISHDGAEADEIDITTMNSPGKWRQFVSGLKDAQAMTVNLVYEKSNMSTLMANYALANETWIITLKDGSTLTVSGFIKQVGSEIPFDDKITQVCTIRLSGPAVFAEGP